MASPPLKKNYHTGDKPIVPFRLQDLPPELRVMIHAAHFSSFARERVRGEPTEDFLHFIYLAALLYTNKSTFTEAYQVLLKCEGAIKDRLHYEQTLVIQSYPGRIQQASTHQGSTRRLWRSNPQLALLRSGWSMKSRLEEERRRKVGIYLTARHRTTLRCIWVRDWAERLGLE